MQELVGLVFVIFQMACADGKLPWSRAPTLVGVMRRAICWAMVPLWHERYGGFLAEQIGDFFFKVGNHRACAVNVHALVFAVAARISCSDWRAGERAVWVRKWAHVFAVAKSSFA
jgi:hypothetical protein